MEIIKNGTLIGNKIWISESYDDDITDEIGNEGIIKNTDGSFTEYDFSGLDSMFNRAYYTKEKTKPLTWYQKLKQSILDIKQLIK